MKARHAIVPRSTHRSCGKSSVDSGLRTPGSGHVPPAHGPQPPASSRGFTLVELLVTISLVSLVVAVCAATLSGAFRVWQRLTATGTQQSWALLAFDRLRQDLHSIRHFAPIPFEGAYDQMSFPALIPVMLEVTSDGEKELVESDELGRRGYFFDSMQRRLCRSEHSYRRLRHARLRERCAEVLTGVERVRFAYCAGASDGNRAEWVSAWSSPTTPSAVKIDVEYREPPASRPTTRSWVIRLPLRASSPPSS